MATNWETFPVPLNGGIVSNLSRLQQGINSPGSARSLINFEPSIKGGYRRINGFVKWDDEEVPAGDIRVQGSGQTGTSLDVANVLDEPTVGSTITIDGVTGTYTIDAVSYNSTTRTATLTLDTSLASSPADKAEITVSGSNSKIEGLSVFLGDVYAVRSGIIFVSGGSGWTKVDPVNYGTVTVNGGGQSGGSLTVSGISDDNYVPQVGDQFTIAGVELIYTVTTVPTVSGGGTTVDITPDLDSSPTNGAAITLLNSDNSGSKIRFDFFNYDGKKKMIGVGGKAPFVIDEDGVKTLITLSQDVIGASHVANFKDSMFYAKGPNVTFTEAFDENGFNTGAGAGTFRVPKDVTGLYVFRETLFIFMEDRISKVTGTGTADFALSTVTDDVGCAREDTIQEVGGDVAFVSTNGVRLLSASDRESDFGLSLASAKIQDETTSFLSENTDFCSTTVPDKNQYRLFGYQSNLQRQVSNGFIGVQFQPQDPTSFAWGKTRGIKAYRAANEVFNATEIIVHSEDTGYVYQQEQGNDFDGDNIDATFATAWLSINDPRFRKTQYKLTTYLNPEGNVIGTVTPKFNFSSPDTVQPESDDLSAANNEFSLYGSGVYGTSTYGTAVTSVIETPVEGSFFTVSYEFQFNNTTKPFIIDTITIEYMTNDRE